MGPTHLPLPWIPGNLLNYLHTGRYPRPVTHPHIYPCHDRQCPPPATALNCLPNRIAFPVSWSSPKPRLTFSPQGLRVTPLHVSNFPVTRPTRPLSARGRQKPEAPRPDEAPNPSTRASVPSITDRRALTSCNQV